LLVTQLSNEFHNLFCEEFLFEMTLPTQSSIYAGILVALRFPLLF